MKDGQSSCHKNNTSNGYDAYDPYNINHVCP